MTSHNPSDKIPIQAVCPALQFALHEIFTFADNCGVRPIKILEVGCGIRSAIGTRLRNASRAIILHGLDIDEYARDNREVDRVFIDSVENIPLGNRTYDVVIAQYLLEHENYRRALSEMGRVVAYKGMLVLTVSKPDLFRSTGNPFNSPMGSPYVQEGYPKS